MARSNKWDIPQMAAGDPKPAWPLPTVTPKFSVTSFGGGRPWGCKEGACERWHAGIDLTSVPDGAVILAPEDALLYAVDQGWSEGGKAAYLRTPTGLFIVMGGFKAGSHKEFGLTSGAYVKKGAPLGRVLGSYGMIHLETYAATPDRRTNSRWYTDKSPPSGLLNPTNYIELMVGPKISLLRPRQRHEALKALGYYAGDVAAPWSAASKAALKAAQIGLGVTADGVWGPATEAAIWAKLGPGWQPQQYSPPQQGFPAPQQGGEPPPADPDPEPPPGVDEPEEAGPVPMPEPPKNPALVTADGGRSSVQPCQMVGDQLVCQLPDLTAWLAAAEKQRQFASEAMERLGALVVAKKVKWTAAEQVADERLVNDCEFVILDEKEGRTGALQVNERVQRLVVAAQVAVESRQVFEAAEKRATKKKKSGGGLVAALAGGTVLAIGVAVAATSRRS